MSVAKSLFLFGLVSRVLAQSSSSSDQMFSIQTDPATPTSSSSSPTPSDQIGGLGGEVFPEQCAGTCSPLADTFLNCGLSDFAGFNVTCLCNPTVENTFLECIECALGAEANPENAVGNYQRLMDAYIQQCETASTTLPSVTVQIPSSTSGSASGNASDSSTSSASGSSTSSRSSSAPSSSASVSTTTNAPSSAGSAAATASASTTSPNTASRGVDQAWLWGLTGVGGVVVAAALGV